jgi:hypothetical protein
MEFDSIELDWKPGFKRLDPRSIRELDGTER